MSRLRRPTRPARPARFKRRSALVKRCTVAVLALSLSGCSWFDFLWKPHTSAVPPGGSLSVAPASDFLYVPARDGLVSPNRIENTAMSGIVMKNDINQAVRNSVENELRIAGFHLDAGTRVLSGSIEKFSVDDVRSPALWTLKMRYVVTDAATREIVYTTTKTVHQQRPKFTSNVIAIDDTVKLNVRALIDDPAFVKSVN